MDGASWTLRGTLSRPRGSRQRGCSERGSEDKPELVGLQERSAARGNVAGERAGHKRMIMSQVSGKSLGWLPSLGSWLLAGKNSRTSHSKEKEGLFGGDTHSADRMWAISEDKRGLETQGG